MRRFLVPVIGAVLILLPACSRVPGPSVSANESPTVADAAPLTASNTNALPESQAPATQVSNRVSQTESLALVPGSTVRVRLLQTIDTERNRPGDRFQATLDEPLVAGDRVIVPKGTAFTGHITESRRSGRVKGRAVLALSLDSFELHGRTYAVRTSSAARVSGGHKKRNWLWLGGGSAGGALIGAAASGGTGALIGGGAGAAAGTVGMLFTGRKDVRLPVESAVTFTIQSRVSLS
jgi:hypothetical protein